MKITKLAALALVAVLLVLAVSCSEPEKKISAPTEITLTCFCGETHDIDIKDCVTWNDVINKNSEVINKTGVVYKCGVKQGFIRCNDSAIYNVNDPINTEGTYTVRNDA